MTTIFSMSKSPSDMSEQTSRSKKGQIMSTRMHVLKRPDNYIGSIDIVEDDVFVYDDDLKKIVLRNMKYNEALDQIFVEILTNSIDNKVESEKAGIKMTKINIDIQDDGTTTISNDGLWIDIEKMTYEVEDEKDPEKTIEMTMYPPELYFGHIRSGTNYDDEEANETNGRNGVGSKSTNIYSKEFHVHCIDPKRGKEFRQSFFNNMKERTKPQISSISRKTGLVEIRYIPDFARFGFEDGYSQDFIALFKKRAYDCAMNTGLKVTFNGEKIEIKNLQAYAKMYVEENTNMITLESENCEVVLTEQSRKDAVKKGFRHVSFVNKQMTKKGGIHVDQWIKSLLGSVRDHMNRGEKKSKKKDDEIPKIKFEHLKKYFFIFVNATISDKKDRKYDSQMKHELKSGKVTLTKLAEAQIKKILKWDFAYYVIDEVKTLDTKRSLKKSDALGSELLGSKISEANFAKLKSKEKRAQCLLIVCEGDSAMTTAVAGRAALEDGPDTIGIMPLRGKVVNACNISVKALYGNKEITFIKGALGLKHGVDYSKPEEQETLRYGRGITIMGDQDSDGFHIVGLVLNFFFREYPELIKAGLVSYVNTPVVEIPLKDGDMKPYYSYQSFKKDQANAKVQQKWIKSWRKGIRYYKGLGTWDYDGAAELFQDLKLVVLKNDENEDYFMDLGFNKLYADKKKRWLLSYDPDGEVCELNEKGEFITKNIEVVEGSQTLSDFVDNKLILYHKENLDRMIPDVIDGWKEGQRKVVDTCFKKKLNENTVKVAQIAGMVSECTVYHHGETSLHDTILKLAQGFVGARNIPIITNKGQFGSRLQGGEDSANPRYLKAQLENITSFIFRSEDYAILPKIVDEGKEYEPVHFVPVVPMLLINGTKAIGSGYSSTIPPYNPKDIVSWLRCWIAKKEDDEDSEFPELVPWWRNFKGTITVNKEKKHVKTRGILEEDEKDPNLYHVRELPIGFWTADFKEYIEEKFIKKKCIVDLREYNTPNSVHFIIKAHPDFKPDIECNMKQMESTVHLSNMVALKDGRPKKYDTVEEILEDFCPVRYDTYVRRKEYLLEKYRTSLVRDENKKRFIEEVISEELIVKERDETELFDEMRERGYAEYVEGEERKAFAYLLDMPLRSMTKQRIENLKKSVETVQNKIEELEEKTPGKLWLEDLEEFETAYEKFLKTRNDDVSFKKRKKSKKE